MITRDLSAFIDLAHRCTPDFGPATARAAFLVAPDGFARAEQSASDNRYMHDSSDFDADCAHAQHHELQRALSSELPVVCFAGDADTPDAVFPNNVFATAPGRLVIGRMRHAVRQLEAHRHDIRGFFTEVMGYAEHDLSTPAHACGQCLSLSVHHTSGHASIFIGKALQ